MATQRCKNNEKTWSIFLYRMEDEVWKKQYLQSSQMSSSSSSSKTNHETTTVSPNIDSITFPALRLRFSLKSKTDDRVTVIRRNNDRILLTSKYRMKTLLLQFQSRGDCLDFSDAFVRLNPHESAAPSPPPLSRPLLTASPNQITHNSVSDQTGIYPIVPDSEYYMLSLWLHEMVWDESFWGYMSKIETCLVNTNNGKELLESFEERPLSLHGNEYGQF